jgi:beta-lactamase class A
MKHVDDAVDRIDALLGLGAAPDVEDVFDPSFLAQIPASQLHEIFADMRGQLGACTGHRILDKPSHHARRVRWEFERGYQVEGVIGINEAESPMVVMLNFGVPGHSSDTWEAIARDAATLPGRYCFEVRDLDSDRVLCEVDPRERLCVGSTSKLLLFSCLLDRIASGALHWEDRLELPASAISAPSGVMHVWPTGSPLTVHTAAVLLLTISDNTAADLLLGELGRETIEALAAEIADPGVEPDLPFLSTRAIFRLTMCNRAQQEEYRAADTNARRKLLEGIEADAPALGDITSQAFPEAVGWYFSAAEICRLLARLRPQIDADPIAKDIMAAPPQAVAGEHWSFAGFKGGSSPGRFTIAALVQDERGRSLAVCLTVNAAPEDVNLGACASRVRRATALAAQS